MTFDPYAELGAIVTAFAEQSIAYAVCGAVSLAIHGHPRATKDLDLLVPEQARADAERVLAALGYTLKAAPMRFRSQIEVQRVSRIEGDELFTVDLIIASGPLDEVWETRTTVRWRDAELAVVSREGLVAMKRLAGRPQDLADLHSLGESIDG